MRHHGKAQSRCSDLVMAQAAELVARRVQTLSLRAAVIIQETALFWKQKKQIAWQALVPDLPCRMALTQRVDHLITCVHELMQERLHWQWQHPLEAAMTSAMPECRPSKPVETHPRGAEGRVNWEKPAAFKPA